MSALHVCILFICVTGIVSCPPGWENFGGSCYCIQDKYVDWPTAAAECRKTNAALVEVDSQDEENFLMELIKAFKATHPTVNEYWLGGSDAFIEGSWRWVESGTQFTYSNWSPGEPNDLQHQEDCLELNTGMHSSWNDGNCTAKNHFICETVRGWVPIG